MLARPAIMSSAQCELAMDPAVSLVVRLKSRGANVAMAALACLVALGPARADDYFKGKTIRLVVGTPPGGGYDTYGRLVARYLGELLPGRPSVIVANMPGASGMKAAYYIYAIAPKDGTVIATFNKSIPFYQALGLAGAG